MISAPLSSLLAAVAGVLAQAAPASPAASAAPASVSAAAVDDNAPYVDTTMVAIDMHDHDAVLLTQMRSQLKQRGAVKNTFDVPFLSLPSGQTPRWLKLLNAELQQTALSPSTKTDPATALAALPTRVGSDGRLQGHAGASFEVLVNHGHYFALRQCTDTVGAAGEAVEHRCVEHRFDTRTGKAWAWRDAIAPGQRAAFDKACSAQLQTALATTATTTTTTTTAPACTALPFVVTAEGELRFELAPAGAGSPGHGFTLPLDTVRPFLAEQGPLGFWKGPARS